MEHAVLFDGSVDLDGDGDKPITRASCPRRRSPGFDIIVDFAAGGIQPGDKITW
jgi:hypothetical protein